MIIELGVGYVSDEEMLQQQEFARQQNLCGITERYQKMKM